MFIGFAAVLLVTSGLAKISLGLDAPLAVIAACLAVFTGACLIAGQYRWMDKMVKGLLLILFASTIIATALSAPLIDWRQTDVFTPDVLNRSSLLFLAALVGWMPAPFEACLWQSLWVLEKGKQANLSRAEVKIDYHVGYFSTLLMAVCFLMLGAAVMHGSGQQFSSGAAEFSVQLINIYASVLGSWTKPVIAVAAFAVMLSTALVIHDGYPRTVTALFTCLREQPTPEKLQSKIYTGAAISMILVSLSIVLFFIQSFKTLIDIVTTLAFITAPVLAWLIHRAMHSEDVPAAAKPAPALTRYSMVCIWALALFAIFFRVCTCFPGLEACLSTTQAMNKVVANIIVDNARQIPDRPAIIDRKEPAPSISTHSGSFNWLTRWQDTVVGPRTGLPYCPGIARSTWKYTAPAR